MHRVYIEKSTNDGVQPTIKLCNISKHINVDIVIWCTNISIETQIWCRCSGIITIEQEIYITKFPIENILGEHKV